MLKTDNISYLQFDIKNLKVRIEEIEFQFQNIDQMEEFVMKYFPYPLIIFYLREKADHMKKLEERHANN